MPLPTITRITEIESPQVVGEPFAISGTLLDENGAPLSGYGDNILVELWRGGYPAPDRSNVAYVGNWRTNYEDGTWEARNIVCKSWDIYYLTAKFAGNEEYDASQHGVRLKHSLMPTVLAVTDVVEPRQVGVPYPYGGTLLDQNGDPVPRLVNLSLYQGDSVTPESTSSARAAEDGTWVANMTCLARDTYVLVAEFDGDSAYAGAPEQRLSLPTTVPFTELPPETVPEPGAVPAEPLPNAPGSISAIVQETSIYVDWYEVYEAEMYVLYRNLTQDLATAVLLPTPVGDISKYTDYDVLPGRTYYYWVASRNAAGDSDPTGPAVATFPEPEAPVTEPDVPVPEPGADEEPDEGFVPGDNIRRLMGIVTKRLDEIRQKKADGEWPPW